MTASAETGFITRVLPDPAPQGDDKRLGVCVLTLTQICVKIDTSANEKAPRSGQGSEGVTGKGPRP